MTLPKIASQFVHKLFPTYLFALGFAAALSIGEASAQASGKLASVDSRDGVKISYWWMPNPNATKTVLLLSGGEGGMGFKDGEPRSGNFLIRSRDYFYQNDFNVVLLGNPSDKPRLDHAWRVSAQHAQDVSAVMESVRAKSNLPIWLIGTSNGTISATALGIALQDKVQGLVLTASVVTWKIPQAVPRQDVPKIKVPVLFYHHRDDACVGTLAYEVAGAADRFVNVKPKKVWIVTGGQNANGDPCQAFHWHGFVGMEKQAVDEISSWIKSPQP
jgi:pimeloyl-ACP methyl ester carboxylesterase